MVNYRLLSPAAAFLSTTRTHALAESHLSSSSHGLSQSFLEGLYEEGLPRLQFRKHTTRTSKDDASSSTSSTSTQKEDPDIETFTMVQFTDLHLAVGAPSFWPFNQKKETYTSTKWIMNQVLDHEEKNNGVDFIAYTGDVCEVGSGSCHFSVMQRFTMNFAGVGKLMATLVNYHTDCIHRVHTQSKNDIQNVKLFHGK